MVDYRFSFKRILKLYGTTWIYTAGITLIIIAFGLNEISGMMILRGLFPFLMGTFWYVTMYIEILLISPFLRRIFDWERKNIERVIIVLFILFCFLSTIRKFMDTIYCGLSWGVFLFVLIGYYKKYVYQKTSLNSIIALFSGILLYIIMCVIKYICFAGEGTLLHLGYKVMDQLLSDYKSMPNFIISALIFLSFVNLKIGNSGIVNTIGSATFDVYLLHQVPDFYEYLWHSIYKCDIWMHSKLYILGVMGVVVSLFLISIIVMQIRTRFIEPNIFRLKTVKQIIERVDDFYGNIGL